MMTKLMKLKNVAASKLKGQPRLGRWLRRTQPITQEDDHDDRQEHKRMTMATVMAKRSIAMNRRG
jgi:hypothetical protein